MPKGVEHKITDRKLRAILKHVNGSEMPKGVEHALRMSSSYASRAVNGSEMPKGVEHTSALFAIVPKTE